MVYKWVKANPGQQEKEIKAEVGKAINQPLKKLVKMGFVESKGKGRGATFTTIK